MRRAGLLFALVYVLVYLAPLGVRPLLMPDETRYAEIPREMLAGGDWVVPHLDGLPYYEKPVLDYWLDAASIGLFGHNNFAVRLPSALSAALTALLVFLLARRLWGDQAGLTAAMVQASCTLVFGVAIFNVIDGPLALFVTAAMTAFFLAYRETRPARRRWLLLLFGAACGLAFLTKGFLGLALPAISILPFLVWERRLGEFLPSAWIPLLGAAIVAGPWCVLIGLRAEGFWHHFFWIEHVVRFVSDEVQHQEPLWFFVPVFLVGALPVTGLAHPIWVGLKERAPRGPLARYATTWLLAPLVFFSLSSGKLGTYILPCYPPFALLVAACVEHYVDTRESSFLRSGMRLAALLVGLLTAALLLLRGAGPGGLGAGGALDLFPAADSWKLAFFVGALLWGVVSLLLAARAPTTRAVFQRYLLLPALFYLGVQLAIPSRLTELKVLDPLVAAHKPRLGSKTLLVGDHIVAPTLAWLLRRDDVRVIDKLDERGWGVDAGERLQERVLPAPRVWQAAREATAGRGHVVLVVRAPLVRGRYARELPPPDFVARDGGFVWLEYGRAVREARVSHHARAPAPGAK